MITAKKCCFCISLQTGCIIIALMGLFLSGMNIDYIMYLLNRTYSRETQYKFPEQILYTCLQLIPDLLSVLASCLLLIAIISQYFWLFWTTLFIQAFQAVYLVSFSIISSTIGFNAIINESFWHNITYWIYVVLWLALTLYFMYVIYSYYRQLKERDTENVVE
ncbi:uncharacterized protein LOC108028490 isoform X1 [Drosophila biarmipes]|uniref:uncharacterized protein LOC108028490 isoform X1 n=1 Tax=Drosophila biarmipes TaxID=125945 RepID=UPI0007E788B8|nr:uncharacterized protein LOC108028490 isoform X1 [Drosophila biarmipes]XP_050741767.1 uncharacterized protein LOC108028490 isoform X1 [Drosophila biarmipes]XP_050741768.1 uncharacterized protein LOC108028490 isoform X1 [Drosophila biarmipes]